MTGLNAFETQARHHQHAAKVGAAAFPVGASVLISGMKPGINNGVVVATGRTIMVKTGDGRLHNCHAVELTAA
jgi:hypothetical protein